MIKKSTLIKLAATAGLMTGFAVTTQYSNLNAFQPQIVQASRKYTIKLTHNAYIYNYRGKRRGRKVLKKGRTYTAYRTKRIHHKRYYYLGHHNYIKAGNAKKNTNSTTKYLFEVNINYLDLEAGVVYKKPNEQKTSLTLLNTVKVYGEKKDSNGTVWYQVGRNEWINSYGTNKPKGKQIKSHNSVATTKSSSTKTNSSSQSNKPKNNSTNFVTKDFANKVEHSFIQQLNELRSKQGKRPFIENNELNNYAKIRSIETQRNFGHIRPNGQKTKYGEVLSDGAVRPEDTPEQIASEILNGFIYNDADSNWGHRDLLLNGSYNQMGCGFSINTNNSNKYSAIYDFVANFY